MRSNRISLYRLHGSSLIEVLIAFIVLGLGISSLVSFQGTLTFNSSHAKARSEAANLAETKLEELRNFDSLSGFSAIASGSDSTSGSNAYTRTWTVTTTPTYKVVAMQVTWPDKTGQVTANTTLAMNTIIARVDPSQTVLNVSTTTTTTTSVSTTSTTTTTSNTTTTTASATTTTTSGTTTTTTAATTTTTASTTSTTASTTTTTSGSYTITISGSFTHRSSGIQVDDVAISSGTCTFSDSSYSCTTGSIPTGSTWSGSISIDLNGSKVVCGGSSTSYSAIASNQTKNYSLAGNSSGCS